MTDKEYRTQKKRVEALIKKWSSALGLGWWEMNYIWVRGSHDGSPTAYAPFSGKEDKFTCIMDVATDYYYKTASVRFFLETIADYDDIERYFLHEMAHIILKPMQTKSKAAEEELVATMLANAFLWSREAGAKDK